MFLAIFVTGALLFVVASLLGLRYIKDLILQIGIEHVIVAIVIGLIIYCHRFVLAILEWLLGVIKTIA